MGPSKRHRFSAVSILTVVASQVAGCAPETIDIGPEEIAQVSQALTPAQPGRRRTIHELSAGDRQTLANAILAFVTQSVLTEHSTGHDWHHPAVGELFFIRHHHYL